MKKKFKIIDTSTGQKIKLKEGEMVVMNSQGIFFVVGNIMGYDTYVLKLSDRIPKFDVVWVGEGE
jgi:hypothetical protein